MLYAKITLGLPVDGPFDYIVPPPLEKKIKIGARAWVSFGAKKKALGYVVGLIHETGVQNLKEISGIIDDAPILDRNMLSLTKEIADYYCCSWGEAIETAIPALLRGGRRIPDVSFRIQEHKFSKAQRPPQTIGERPPQYFGGRVMLLYDPGIKKRWDIYLGEIKSALANKESVIIILADVPAVMAARETIASNINAPVSVLFRKEKGELEEWIKIRSTGPRVVVGTRSSIFAPVAKLGLIIIEEEQEHTYKQDQVPHYHATGVAFMRVKTEKAKLILSSASPLLETFLLARKNKIDYKFIPLGEDFPQVDTVDMSQQYRFNKEKGALFSKFMLDAISAVLASHGKVLLLFNRKGFATVAYCHNCGKTLRCPRCSINLVYHFQENKLTCHYCTFKMDLPKICPDCNAGYIKFSGAGAEKVESEICRIFPQAKVARGQTGKKTNCDDADIFVATSSIIKQEPCLFDLVGVLGIDNSLNRVDFRASEHAFGLLSGLLRFTRKRMIVQTQLAHHNIFVALAKKDLEKFYGEELKQRKQLNFPPWRHIVYVKVRGPREERVKEITATLSAKLEGPTKHTRLVSVVVPQPARLRGNYYRHILLSTSGVKKAVIFIKKVLKGFPHSGIIVTVDVDPV
ncbi:MAG: primosomal protein N' [Candidatus Omnitrophota bacterium]